MPSNNIRYRDWSARTKLRKRLKASGIAHCQNPHCGVLLDWDTPYLPNSAELDERIPVSKLPKPLQAQMCVDPRNIQVLCRRCNREKSNKLNWTGEKTRAEVLPHYEKPISPIKL